MILILVTFLNKNLMMLRRVLSNHFPSQFNINFIYPALSIESKKAFMSSSLNVSIDQVILRLKLLKENEKHKNFKELEINLNLEQSQRTMHVKSIIAQFIKPEMGSYLEVSS